ncbi:MAG: phosphoribosylanthranilate isomerase [Pseudomonadales bacterium]|nr:phosphoribosylanthranilate isomerase [Pseudomonadales bacterium]
MRRTRVKICGITNAEDAAGAVASGADALGFNFFPGSVRFTEAESARDIATELPAFVAKVALFVNESVAGIESILKVFQPDLLQFHGEETPDFCQQFGLPYIKALAATGEPGFADSVAAYTDARGVLLDTRANGSFGGTGETFDWSLVPALSMPVILAGGLNAGNVREAIRQVSPYAVDVSGGVEKSKGQKDIDKMQAFCAAVREADQEEL